MAKRVTSRRFVNARIGIFNFLLGASSVFLISACGNLNQDPLAGKSDSVKNPQKPGQDKPIPQKPEKSDYIFIDAPDLIQLKEGVDGGPKMITARITAPVENEKNPKVGRNFDIRILNLDSFLGATYDQLKGEFRWIPPQGTVTQDQTRIMSLDVEVVTRAKYARVGQKSIPLWVSKFDNAPEVVKVEGLPSRVPEGTKHTFTITVRDKDATDSPEGRPRLVIGPSQNTQGRLPQLIAFAPGGRVYPNPMRDPTDPTLWRFSMILDSTGQDLTTSSVDLSFDAVVYSQFGKISSPNTTKITFITSVGEPICSWRDAVEIPGGQPASIAFTVYDLKGRGQIAVSFARCAERGATCKCTYQGWNQAVQNCTVSWTPPNLSYPVDYQVQLSATNTNPIDRSVKQMSCAGRIRVNPAPRPASPEENSHESPSPEQSRKSGREPGRSQR